MKYEVRHTVDDLGGRYLAEHGVVSLETADLDEATRQAARLTAHGNCGFVRNSETGSILLPDGTWSKPNL